LIRNNSATYQCSSLFYVSWSAIVKTCVPHIDAGGHLAYIISPTHSVIDHVTDMLPACKECG
jgi:hypothetical protein